MSPIRVLVAGHDSGGLNLLAPLLRAWSGDSRIQAEFLSTPVVCRDMAHSVPGLTVVAAADGLDEWKCHRPGELDPLLANVIAARRYDAVVCSTSGHISLERRVLLAAQTAGIPSVAFCDMWYAYALRFREGDEWCLPSRLWAIDLEMRRQLQDETWARSLPVDVIGSPLYETLLAQRSGASGPAGRSIRFISEPASTKFPQARLDEFALADWLVSAAHEAGIDRPIVIRPHPVDSMESWRRWIFARRHLGAELDVLPLHEAIKDTWVAAGLSSIMLTELRMCGIPAASLQPPDADQTYFCIPFEAQGIARVRTPESLASWLRAPLSESSSEAKSIHSDATQKATAALLRLVETTSISVGI